ncbi:MAG: hypothetical protein Q9224_003719, partial [Gallowayella concinna]
MQSTPPTVGRSSFSCRLPETVLRLLRREAHTAQTAEHRFHWHLAQLPLIVDMYEKVCQFFHGQCDTSHRDRSNGQRLSMTLANVQALNLGPNPYMIPKALKAEGKRQFDQTKLRDSDTTSSTTEAYNSLTGISPSTGANGANIEKSSSSDVSVRPQSTQMNEVVGTPASQTTGGTDHDTKLQVSTPQSVVQTPRPTVGQDPVMPTQDTNDAKAGIGGQPLAHGPTSINFISTTSIISTRSSSGNDNRANTGLLSLPRSSSQESHTFPSVSVAVITGTGASSQTTTASLSKTDGSKPTGKTSSSDVLGHTDPQNDGGLPVTSDVPIHISKTNTTGMTASTREPAVQDPDIVTESTSPPPAAVPSGLSSIGTQFRTPASMRGASTTKSSPLSSVPLVDIPTTTWTAALKDYKLEIVTSPGWTSDTLITTTSPGSDHPTLVPVFANCEGCGPGGSLIVFGDFRPSISYHLPKLPGFPQVPRFHLPCIAFCPSSSGSSPGSTPPKAGPPKREEEDKEDDKDKGKDKENDDKKDKTDEQDDQQSTSSPTATTSSLTSCTAAGDHFDCTRTITGTTSGPTSGRSSSSSSTETSSTTGTGSPLITDTAYIDDRPTDIKAQDKNVDQYLLAAYSSIGIADEQFDAESTPSTTPAISTTSSSTH